MRDETLRSDLVDTLDRCFADNVNAWELDSEGNYTRQKPAGEPRSVQRELMAAHAAAAAEASSQSQG